MPLPQKRLILALLLALVIAAFATPPLWWSAGSPPVIAPGAPENNKGPANIGQAKHMAKSALDALEAVLPDLATHIEADLVGAGKPIPSWDAPATQAERDKNHAPLLIGQLKAIADPFYNHLHAIVPNWLEAERTANGTNHPGSIFPWTTETTDDANKGMANIGQLKAVFSLRFETLATFDSDGDGMPDLWEIQNGLNPNDPDDANQDNDGDGLNNAQELAAGLDPNSAEIWGPVNADFRDFIYPSVFMSFRDEHPSDLYYGDDVVGWQANEGDNYIEIWQEDDDSTPEPDDGDRYIELQSHLDAHGVKQEFPMLSESRMTFILRYKGRYEHDKPDPYHNAFELKVKGAAKLIVDGTEVTEDNGVRTRLFTDTEEWQEWQYASVTIIAPEDEAGFSDITLSLVPDETEEGGEHITHGGFVSLLPIDIVAHKRGTIDTPGEEQPKGIGEYGYETVMMENADSEDNSTGKRDCDTSEPADKAEDDDFVKIVLHYPGLKIEGASLELKHEGIAVDAKVKGNEMDNPEDAIEVLDTGSRLKFYREDGTLIEDPDTELKINDLKNPGTSYLAKIVDPANDGKLTLFIEGKDKFGLVGYRDEDLEKLGGSRLKWVFEKGDKKAEIPVLVYRGGFLVFKQPKGKPGEVANFELWDGKGRIRHEFGGFGNEFKEDDTDFGEIIATWVAKSGKPVEAGNPRPYNVAEKSGHIPPGWYWEQSATVASSEKDLWKDGILHQGPYVRWKEDKTGVYKKDYRYDPTKDSQHGKPTAISFKYQLDPINNWVSDPSRNNYKSYLDRTRCQVHPDGEQNGSGGCISIQNWNDCREVLYVLKSYNALEVKVQLEE